MSFINLVWDILFVSLVICLLGYIIVVGNTLYKDLPLRMFDIIGWPVTFVKYILTYFRD